MSFWNTDLKILSNLALVAYMIRLKCHRARCINVLSNLQIDKILFMGALDKHKASYFLEKMQRISFFSWRFDVFQSIKTSEVFGNCMKSDLFNTLFDILYFLTLYFLPLFLPYSHVFLYHFLPRNIWSICLKRKHSC